MAKFFTGAGEAGKSTLLKQMRVIYAEGFSPTERNETRLVIFSNIITAFRMIAQERRDLDLRYQHDSSYVSFRTKVAASLLNLMCCRATNKR